MAWILDVVPLLPVFFCVLQPVGMRGDARKMGAFIYIDLVYTSTLNLLILAPLKLFNIGSFVHVTHKHSK